jgi:hydroxymethylpyrimidine/phosphomethylpyrimidine kinase
MSIAGYDPTGGAGVLADIKVFEQHKTYGFAVITSNTFQNDSEVKHVDWISIEDIKKQMDVILNKFKVDVFKIGILENEKMLLEVKDHVLKKDPELKIVWDPILSSTSGFDFFKYKTPVKELLKGIYLITPNLPEFEKLFTNENNALEISEQTAIYLKGGHNEHSEKGVDELFSKGKRIVLKPKTTEVSSKHGSGCILSSAIAANLALGNDLLSSCKKAKIYTEKKLASNNTLLAYHH